MYYILYIIYIYIYVYINFVCLYLKMSNDNLFKKTFFYLKLTNYFEIAPISFIVEHYISILCLQIYLKHITYEINGTKNLLHKMNS